MRRRKLIAPPDQAPSVSAQRRSPSSVVAGARANPFMFGLLGALGVLVALMIGGIVGQLATGSSSVSSPVPRRSPWS